MKLKIEQLFGIGILLTAVVVSFLLGIEFAPLFSNELTSGDSYSIVVATTTADNNDSSTAIEKIALNSATAEELMTIPGIGEVLAKRIVEYRDLVGGFSTLEQLKEVSGVGEGRYAQWLPYLTLN